MSQTCIYIYIHMYIYIYIRMYYNVKPIVKHLRNRGSGPKLSQFLLNVRGVMRFQCFQIC